MMVPTLDGLFDLSLDLREPQEEPPVEELVELDVDPQEPIKTLKMEKNLEGKVKEELKNFLKENLKVFAWKHFDMLGIFLDVMCHHLNINLEKRHV